MVLICSVSLVYLIALNTKIPSKYIIEHIEKENEEEFEDITGIVLNEDYDDKFARRRADSYTIVISTYDRDLKLILHTDHWLKCPMVNQVHIIWHDPTRDIPEYLQEIENEYNCNNNTHVPENFRKEICTKCEYCSDRRLFIRKQKTDDLTNRFLIPAQGYETDAIFSVDEDFVIDCSLVYHAFLQWKRLGKYSLVGFEPRLYNWHSKSMGYVWHDSCNEDECRYNTLFATKGGFLHSMFFNFFFEDQFSFVRNLSSTFITGEDMLMCFVHYVKTKQLTGHQPPILTIQAAPGLNTRASYYYQRTIGLYQHNYHKEKEIVKPLKKYQYEGDGIELSGRTARFRPRINQNIGELSKKLLDPFELPKPSNLWHFVHADSSYFTSDNVCGNQTLIAALECTQHFKIQLYS